MDVTFLKLGIAVFIAIIGVYICFNVLTPLLCTYKLS